MNGRYTFAERQRDERGVKWSRTSLGRDWPDMEDAA